MKQQTQPVLILVLWLILCLSPVSAPGDGITLPAGLTELEDEVFSGCASISSVTLPAGLTGPGEDVSGGFARNVLFRCERGSMAMDLLRSGRDVDAGARYRALLIGQSYAGTRYRLDGPSYDVDNMRAALSAFPDTPYSVTVARDLTGTGIRNAILSAFADADEYDVSLLFYSGHGIGGTGALVGTDFRTHFSGLLRPSELRRVLDRIPGRKIVIVDACYSGHIVEELRSNGSDFSAGDGGGFAGAFVSAFRGGLSANDADAASRAFSRYYVMAACAPNELSYEFTGNSRWAGIFSWSLGVGLGWDGLRNAACERYADEDLDGLITFGEAFAFARRYALAQSSGQTAQSNAPDESAFCPFR